MNITIETDNMIYLDETGELWSKEVYNDEGNEYFNEGERQQFAYIINGLMLFNGLIVEEIGFTWYNLEELTDIMAILPITRVVEKDHSLYRGYGK